MRYKRSSNIMDYILGYSLLFSLNYFLHFILVDLSNIVKLSIQYFPFLNTPIGTWNLILILGYFAIPVFGLLLNSDVKNQNVFLKVLTIIAFIIFWILSIAFTIDFLMKLTPIVQNTVISPTDWGSFLPSVTFIFLMISLGAHILILALFYFLL